MEPNLLQMYPLRSLTACKAFPTKIESGTVSMLMAEPDNLVSLTKLEFAADLDVLPVKCTSAEIDKLLQEHSHEAKNADSPFATLAEAMKRERLDEVSAGSTDDLKKSSQAEPVVKMVDMIIDEAIKAGASDIHIEPNEDKVLVRNRIDGLLRNKAELPHWMSSALTSRIKILADLDIAEKRVPQDGRIKRTVDGISIDLRISTLPTHFGEKTVIRVLRHTADLFSLENLGYTDDEIKIVNDLIHKPQGIIFVTGPTGSGKSSSLFAFLNRIKGKEINITTIENPIEIKLSGINQVQVNEKAGLTFASTLRSILRQDPDVILIGEIRDKETAEIAIRAAQTGHLVFSTLHTNDAISAITRLRDLGIEPFLTASSLLSVIAQRLVRRICPHCKERFEPSEMLMFKYRHLFGDVEIPDSYIGKGCNRCNNTGFEGRVGVFELLVLNQDLRQMIMDRKNDIEIKEMAMRSGMRPIHINGLAKVREGITSMEELLRVVSV
ncbi:MAG: type II/IV secretion system protein [Fibrobacteres bacterium]|nr:type II/IV secretion system protein [Fibrobacterota bacterium]